MDAGHGEHLLKDITNQVGGLFNKAHPAHQKKRELVIQASTWLLRERNAEFGNLQFFLEIETERRTKRYCLDNLEPAFMRECLGNGSARLECRGLLKSARLLLSGNLSDLRQLDVNVCVHAEQSQTRTYEIAA